MRERRSRRDRTPERPRRRVPGSPQRGAPALDPRAPLCDGRGIGPCRRRGVRGADARPVRGGVRAPIRPEAARRAGQGAAAGRAVVARRRCDRSRRDPRRRPIRVALDADDRRTRRGDGGGDRGASRGGKGEGRAGDRSLAPCRVVRGGQGGSGAARRAIRRGARLDRATPRGHHRGRTQTEGPPSRAVSRGPTAGRSRSSAHHPSSPGRGHRRGVRWRLVTVVAAIYPRM